MIKEIRKIGNSNGIIIPKAFLEELGSPTVIDVSLIDGGLFICPVTEKITRGKPRDEDEANGIMVLASTKIKNNIESGKVRWTGEREMEREIEI